MLCLILCKSRSDQTPVAVRLLCNHCVTSTRFAPQKRPTSVPVSAGALPSLLDIIVHVFGQNPRISLILSQKVLLLESLIFDAIVRIALFMFPQGRFGSCIRQPVKNGSLSVWRRRAIGIGASYRRATAGSWLGIVRESTPTTVITPSGFQAWTRGGRLRFNINVVEGTTSLFVIDSNALLFETTRRVGVRASKTIKYALLCSSFCHGFWFQQMWLWFNFCEGYLNDDWCAVWFSKQQWTHETENRIGAFGEGFQWNGVNEKEEGVFMLGGLTGILLYIIACDM